IMSRFQSGRRPNKSRTCVSSSRCWPVTQVLQWKFAPAESSLTTGASLIASGRVPKTNRTFIAPAKLGKSMREAGGVDDDAAHQFLARNFAKSGMCHQHRDDVCAADRLQGLAERGVRQSGQLLW